MTTETIALPMWRKRSRDLYQIYRYQVRIATAVALVVVPYIWVTNTTASPATIFLHVGLMWIFLPPLMVPVDWAIENLATKRIRRLTVSLVGISLALSVSATITVVLFHLIVGLPLRLLISPPLLTGLLPLLTAYAMITFSRLWRAEHEYQLQLQAQRDRATFQALSAQLKPHFFFNSLNTLEYLIESSPKDAVTCLQKLSSLYRKVLEGSKENTVPLEDEMDLVRDYLAIQTFRFQDKLKARWEIDGDFKKSRMPPNLLLNLVENAVKHGIESIAESRLHIAIKRLDPRLIEIVVSNDYSAQNEQKKEGAGFGQQDAKTRLDLVYEGRASMEVRKSEREYAVHLRIPSE